MVPTVDCEEVAAGVYRGEEEGVIAPYEGIVADPWWAEEDCVC